MAPNSVIHVHSIHDGVIAWFLKRNLLINQLLCLLNIPDTDMLKCTITSMVYREKETNSIHSFKMFRDIIFLQISSHVQTTSKH